MSASVGIYLGSTALNTAFTATSASTVLGSIAGSEPSPVSVVPSTSVPSTSVPSVLATLVSSVLATLVSSVLATSASTVLGSITGSEPSPVSVVSAVANFNSVKKLSASPEGRGPT